MVLVKFQLGVPSLDPTKQIIPLNQFGKPIYNTLLNNKFEGDNQPLDNQDRYLIETKGSVQADGKTPVSVAQTVNLIKMTKAIEQLAQLSRYAAIMFEDIGKNVDKLQSRIDTQNSKIQALKKVIPLVEEKIGSLLVADSLGNERSDFKNAYPPDQQLFAATTNDKNGSHLPLAIQKIYQQQCMAPPNLQAMDKFREDGQTSMKFYSYPMFFIEQWRLLMEKEAAKDDSTFTGGKKKKKKVKKDGEASKKTKTVNAADVKVKRYNNAGELIVDEIGAVEVKSPTTQIVQSQVESTESPVYASIPPPPMAAAPKAPVSKAPAAPAPPPPPPAPPAPPPPPSMSSDSASPSLSSGGPPPPPGAPPAPQSEPQGKPGMAALLNQKSNLRSAQVNAPIKKDSRSEMLDGIKGGAISLRKVTIQPKTAAEAKKSTGGNDVASILARRVAMEASDSESDEEGEDDEWD